MSKPMIDKQRDEWLAIRKEAALKIDPATAEVFWKYGSIRDPYGVLNLGPDEEDNVGRNYFARSPGGVWVLFNDLPDATRDALWKKHESDLAFPAGLFPTSFTQESTKKIAEGAGISESEARAASLALSHLVEVISSEYPDRPNEMARQLASALVEAVASSTEVLAGLDAPRYSGGNPMALMIGKKIFLDGNIGWNEDGFCWRASSDFMADLCHFYEQRAGHAPKLDEVGWINDGPFKTEQEARRDLARFAQAFAAERGVRFTDLEERPDLRSAGNA
jgi:hypothetical protein